MTQEGGQVKFYVAGLSERTSADSLSEYFSEFGPVSSVQVMERDGKPRGFGFVTFAEAATPLAKGLLSTATHLIDGKEVTLKVSVPKDELRGGRPSFTCSRLYVGGLSPETTDATLVKHFSQFGKVTQAAVVKDRDGRSRNFGFVSFVNETMAENAFRFRHDIDGKIVGLREAVPQEQLRNGPPMGGKGGAPPPPYGDRIPGGARRIEAPTQRYEPYRGPLDYGAQYAPPPMGGPPAAESRTKLFCKHLSPETTREGLLRHFSKFGPLDDAEVITDRTTGESRGFGFVNFLAAHDAEQALQAQHSIDGSMVSVKRAIPMDSAPAGGRHDLPAFHPPPPRDYDAPPRDYGSRGYGHPRDMGARDYRGRDRFEREPPREYYDRSRERDEIRSDDNLDRKVFVGGLPSHAEDRDLHRHFSRFGRVDSAEVMRRNGESRGFGFVVFRHRSDRDRCLEERHHEIDGKTLGVRTCQSRDALGRR